MRPSASISSRKVSETMKLKVQFAIVPIPAALLRTLSG